jgi:hypothetical protein
MTTAGKEKVKGWLKEIPPAGFFLTENGRIGDSARRKSADQGIGHPNKAQLIAGRLPGLM